MDLISKYRGLEKPRVVGLMSGTSADAIDAALVEIGPSVKLLKFMSTPLSSEIQQLLQDVFEDQGTPRTLTKLHWLLGECFAQAALSVMEQGADLVASHGQTICHLPKAEPFCSTSVRGTLQIGEGAVIAERTGCLTVCDFRPQDLAVGGQGAPLVPFADAILFGNPKCDRVALNIGGMANISWIPRQGPIQAGDTGPGNALSDAIVSMACGRSYDEGGRIAASGRVIPELLSELLNHPYLDEPFPKSTGREDFGRSLAVSLLDKGNVADVLRTVLAFTASSIAVHIERLANQRSNAQDAIEVVAGGGGVNNVVLMQELSQRLPSRCSLQSMDLVGMPIQAREAVAFALMGHETIWGRSSNVPTATGASRKVVLGKIILP